MIRRNNFVYFVVLLVLCLSANAQSDNETLNDSTAFDNAFYEQLERDGLEREEHVTYRERVTSIRRDVCVESDRAADRRACTRVSDEIKDYNEFQVEADLLWQRERQMHEQRDRADHQIQWRVKDEEARDPPEPSALSEW